MSDEQKRRKRGERRERRGRRGRHVKTEETTAQSKITSCGVAGEIREILEKDFIYIDDMAEVLALAIAGGKNVIIYGPGGHAKSLMVESVIKGLELENDCFTQFFGEGMSEDKLFGGMDFKKFNEQNILEYRPEESFLNKKIAVFEELFDAPPVVLLPLKDVLTSKRLRNGSQQYDMKTESIICLTNKQPGEISEMGDSAHGRCCTNARNPY